MPPTTALDDEQEDEDEEQIDDEEDIGLAGRDVCSIMLLFGWFCEDTEVENGIGVFLKSFGDVCGL